MGPQVRMKLRKSTSAAFGRHEQIRPEMVKQLSIYKDGGSGRKCGKKCLMFPASGVSTTVLGPSLSSSLLSFRVLSFLLSLYVILLLGFILSLFSAS